MMSNNNSNNKVLLYFPDTMENLAMIAPPLSLMAIGAYIEKEGFEVVIHDRRIDESAQDNIIADLDRVLAVGITSLTGPQIADGIELSRRIKAARPGVPVAWGGWHPSLLPQQTLSNPYIDYVVRGQGELTFTELLRAFQNKGGINSIRGLLYKKDGDIIDNGPRELVDINLFPSLGYHMIDVRKYPGRPSSRSDVYTTIRTQQGCPHRCEFCAEPIVYHRRTVRYTPQRTVDEIEELVNKYGVTEISFQDPTFVLSPQHLKEFCQGVIDRKLNIKWSATARYTTLAKMDDETLGLLKASGCDMLHPGVEAGSQEMMDYIKKDQSLDYLMDCVEKLARYGIRGLYSFIIGLPGEPEGEISKVFQLVKKIKEADPEAIVPVNFYTPYPISPLYHKAIEHGFEEPKTLEGWKDFSARKNRMPWVNREMEDEVMKKDKYYFPAAFPSEVLKNKMKKGNFKWMYRCFHAIAKFRVKHNWYSFDVDWKLLLRYWKFWEKYNRKLPLHNIHFRW